MSGKYGPNENSVMTWERFMTMLHVREVSQQEDEKLTFVIDMFVAGVTMSKGGNVEIGYSTKVPK